MHIFSITNNILNVELYLDEVQVETSPLKSVPFRKKNYLENTKALHLSPLMANLKPKHVKIVFKPAKVDCIK